jgi:hypothetical protein
MSLEHQFLSKKKKQTKKQHLISVGSLGKQQLTRFVRGSHTVGCEGAYTSAMFSPVEDWAVSDCS